MVESITLSDKMYEKSKHLRDEATCKFGSPYKSGKWTPKDWSGLPISCSET